MVQLLMALLLQPAQHTDLLEKPLPLRSGIGIVEHAVSTASAEAHAFYNQGLAYLHSFVWIEAARSFHQALRLDPKMALAHVGLSYAYTELSMPAAARSAIERALALDGHDRRHIEVRKAQMAAEAAPGDAGKLSAYRQALDDALLEFPSDVELLLQRGVAESSDPADRGQGSVEASITYYQKSLLLEPDHFGAHHYLVHAFENIGRPDEALKHGELFRKLAPSSPHARHMYGHALRRLGRIEEALREFETADRLETEYLKTENVAPEHHWHFHHNLDLLASSYQYAGRMAEAERLMRQSFVIPSNLAVQEFNKRQWPEFLLGRGRYEEASAAARTLAEHASPLIRAAGRIEAGRTMLALGRFKEAADEANAALRELKSAADGAALVATSLQQLQGEFFLRTGQREKGRALLDDAIRKLRAAPGPDQWTQALFALEAIARSAREAGDWEYAARVARHMLEHDPHYAGTHYALALAAARTGERNAERTELRLAEKYWNRADPDLTELREIRSRLQK